MYGMRLQVDQASVLDFKISRLQKAGAGMQAGLSNKAFPLKSASYTAVAAGTCSAGIDNNNKKKQKK